MAQQIINIRNVGQYGVISDPNPTDIPGNAFSNAMNVRFKGTAAEKFGGHVPTLTKSMPTGEHFNSIVGLDEQTWNYKGWIVGTSGKIYRVDESNWTDVSRDGAAYVESPDSWIITRLSNSIVMNRKDDIPQGLTPTALKFVNLPKWGVISTYKEGEEKPTETQEYWRASVVRSYKNFLIALNMEEGADQANAVNYSQRVRWSDAAENGQLPASWDDASPEGFASYNDLGNAEGGIVDAAQLRDSMIIYTNKEVHSMTWIGGSQLFAFRRLFSDTGLIAPGCVVEFESQHFVIGSNDIFVHDGATKRSVIYGRIERKLMNEIRGVNPWATKAFSNAAKKEIWVCYVANGTPERKGGGTANWFDRAAVWNWQDDTWTFYELPSVRALALAPTPDPDSRNWDEQPGNWDEQVEPWNLYDDNFVNESILGASEFGYIFMLDSGDKTYYPEYTDTVTMKEQQMIAFMEKQGMDLDQEGAKIYEEKELFKVWPQVTGSGELKIEVGGQTQLNKANYLEQAQFFDIEEDYVAEFRVAYRYLAFRFESQKPGAWRFSGYDYEIALGTSR